MKAPRQLLPEGLPATLSGVGTGYYCPGRTAGTPGGDGEANPSIRAGGASRTQPGRGGKRKAPEVPQKPIDFSAADGQIQPEQSCGSRVHPASAQAGGAPRGPPRHGGCALGLPGRAEEEVRRLTSAAPASEPGLPFSPPPGPAAPSFTCLPGSGSTSGLGPGTHRPRAATKVVTSVSLNPGPCAGRSAQAQRSWLQRRLKSPPRACHVGGSQVTRERPKTLYWGVAEVFTHQEKAQMLG